MYGQALPIALGINVLLLWHTLQALFPIALALTSSVGRPGRPPTRRPAVLSDAVRELSSLCTLLMNPELTKLDARDYGDITLRVTHYHVILQRHRTGCSAVMGGTVNR